MRKLKAYAGNRHPLSLGYGVVIIFLTLSGFGQMPIFKRYYIADIPGLGWLAKFFVTHYIHYLAAIFFLAAAAFLVTDYLISAKNRFKITASGRLRVGLLAGIVLTGGLLVVRNLSGSGFSPGLIIFLDLAHLGLVMAFLATSAACLGLKKRWTIGL